jgi:TetR/AcrR family transcriptional regulator, mexJK operon transcriptional repressor
MNASTEIKPLPGRPKDLEKRAAILEAAQNLFLSRGFEGTSMDAVAAEAGVSKLTVYSHFGDKDTLFVSAVQSRCERQLPEAMFHVPPHGTPIRKALLAIAHGFHELAHSPETVALHRMMIANSGQSTHLAELFFEAGPKRTLASFERFLREAIAAGELEIKEPARAAGHFLVMLKGLSHMRQLVGCGAPMSDKDRDAHIKSVVDMFLRAYRADDR